MPKPKKPDPTFEVRFVGPGLVPEKIPVHVVSEVLTALQNLASGRDPSQSRHIPNEQIIGLLQIRRGSAVYSCVSRAPDEARHNLTQVGVMLSGLDQTQTEDDLMVTAFRPIETLSQAARSIGCRLEVYYDRNRNSPVFAVDEDDFSRLSKRLLLTGETTVIGRVERVGGATQTKCLLRMPNRKPLLYCNVESDKPKLARELGKHLYENIAATGTATWIHRTWYIYKFTIRDFKKPGFSNPKATIEMLRRAGLDAWDSIPDPESYIREV